jgi:pyruvyltransferase
MNSNQPLAKIRGLPGGRRVVERLTKLVDARRQTAMSRLVRRSMGFPERPIPMYWFTVRPNFGDMLSSVIVEHVSNGTPILVSPSFHGKLLAAGSVLHRLAEGDIVWGAGAIRDEPIYPPPGVRFCAVRGPLTRRLLRAEVPEIYGDPAMLLPEIYAPRTDKRFELGIVPHYVERDVIDVTDPSVTKIDVRSDWRAVIDRIAACRRILSSSLHGLIVAEAYGIPALWITVTDKVIGAGFKFRDYYLSTGREPPPPVAWEQALRATDGFFMEPPPMQTEPLLRAFPDELTFRPG